MDKSGCIFIRICKNTLNIGVIAFVICVTLALASASSTSAKTQKIGDLTVREAQTLVRQAALSGNVALADRLASELLAIDPNDVQALLARAAVAIRLGRPDDAFDAAARAYRSTDDRSLRFDAAVLAADALARQKRFTRLQIWLRRADQVAANDKQRALVARRYRLVSRLNPLSVRLRFSVRPSSNVNNGAASDIIDIGGLPFQIDPSDKQLGGVEAEAGLSVSYRLSETGTHRTDALADILTRRVWLNARAKEIAPDADGADFSYDAIVVGLRHRRLIWPGLGPTRVTALAGYGQYGGEPLSQWGQLQIQQNFRAGARTNLRLGASVRVDDRLDDPVNDSVTWRLEAEATHAPKGGGRYAFGASVSDTASDSATVDALAWAAWARHDFRRLGPIRPALSVFAESRDYRRWMTTPGGRRDLTLDLGAEAALPQVRFYGFIPRVSLTVRKTFSNVDIYDREEVSLGLGAVSRF